MAGLNDEFICISVAVVIHNVCFRLLHNDVQGIRRIHVAVIGYGNELGEETAGWIIPALEESCLCPISFSIVFKPHLKIVVCCQHVCRSICQVDIITQLLNISLVGTDYGCTITECIHSGIIVV